MARYGRVVGGYSRIYFPVLRIGARMRARGRCRYFWLDGTRKIKGTGST